MDAQQEPQDRTVESEMREADRRNGEPDALGDQSARARSVPAGRDTPTGTDPDALYDHPGYEDKSFGQAVAQDRDLAERLARETRGDDEEAERRFERESAGAPAIARQHGRSRPPEPGR